MRAIYQGVRVLDLAGPTGSYASKLFADLGADVLKVEQPGGDPGRNWGPFAGNVPDPDKSLHWWFNNTSKRSIIADIQTEEGRDRVKQLALSADVWIDTAPPGYMESLGLGDALRAANPRLITASLTPFGTFGPRKDWQGTDLIASAMGGLLYLGGTPEHAPAHPGADQSNMIGATSIAVSVALALISRDQTGKGQRVEVSLQEATLVATENAVGFWTFRETIRKRLGAFSFGGTKMVYEASDGWVIGHIGGRWGPMLDWFESYGLEVDQYRDDNWMNAAYRSEHFEEVEPLITNFVKSLPREQIYAEGQQRRMVLGPVRTMPEVLLDRQLIERNFWVPMKMPQLDEPKLFPGAPYRLSNAPWSMSPAPSLGENVAGWKGDEALPPFPQPFDPANPRPLEGIRVVDFGTNVVVPLICKILASFGAEILKVEGRTKIEGQRGTPIPKPVGTDDSPNTNWLFLNSNSDKRSITVNMQVPAAHDFVKQLINTADIVIDNFGVDPMPKWGFSPENLFAMRPDLIIVRASVMGRTGPLQNYVGLGNSIMSTVGLNSITGFEGDPPVATCTAHPDYSSNTHHGLFAILSALYHRNRTGQGQWIDFSQTESTVNFVAPPLLDASVNGNTPKPSNNRHPYWSPHGVFPAKGEDRWIAITTPDEESWKAFAGIVDPSLLDDPRFATAADRKQHEDALDERIAAYTVQFDPMETMEKLQAVGVPAGTVQIPPDLLADPQLLARNFFEHQQHDEAGAVTVLNPHLRLSDTPAKLDQPAPLLGDNTDWAIFELLALDEDTVGNLYVEGAVE